jgi:quercetin dioxygenase-like cupin family protein
MTKRTIRNLLIVLVVLLLQPGCALLRNGPEPHGSGIVVKELIKATRSWDEKPLPAYPQGQPEVSVLRIRIPPGTRLDTHSHPVINAGVLIGGQLTVVTTEGKTLHLKAGDALVEVVNTLHYGISEGDAPAEIVVFYAGAVGTPIAVPAPK